jgi:hypothetical protein
MIASLLLIMPFPSLSLIISWSLLYMKMATSVVTSASTRVNHHDVDEDEWESAHHYGIQRVLQLPSDVIPSYLCARMLPYLNQKDDDSHPISILIQNGTLAPKLTTSDGLHQFMYDIFIEPFVSIIKSHWPSSLRPRAASSSVKASLLDIVEQWMKLQLSHAGIVHHGIIVDKSLNSDLLSRKWSITLSWWQAHSLFAPLHLAIDRSIWLGHLPLLQYFIRIYRECYQQLVTICFRPSSSPSSSSENNTGTSVREAINLVESFNGSCLPLQCYDSECKKTGAPIDITTALVHSCGHVYCCNRPLSSLHMCEGLSRTSACPCAIPKVANSNDDYDNDDNYSDGQLSPDEKAAQTLIENKERYHRVMTTINETKRLQSMLTDGIMWCTVQHALILNDVVLFERLMMWSIVCGHAHILQRLPVAQCGGLLTQYRQWRKESNADEWKAIHLAAIGGHVDVLQYLYDHHPFDSSSINDQKQSCDDHESFLLPQPDALKDHSPIPSIIRNDPLNIYLAPSMHRVTRVDNDALTALTISCRHDRVESVRWLVSHGALVTSRALADAIRGLMKSHEQRMLPSRVQWQTATFANAPSCLSALLSNMSPADIWRDIRARCKADYTAPAVVTAIEAYIWNMCLVPHRLAFMMTATKQKASTPPSSSSMIGWYDNALFDRNVIPMIFEFAALRPVTGFRICY